MSYETIIYEKENGIATLTFNRPHVMNAGNALQYEEMHAALEEAKNDDEVRVLILTGAGRAFHAGDDVRQSFLAADREKRRAESKLAHQVKGIPRAPFLRQFHRPTIAAVNGPAIGAGLDFAISCDIRIASENAKFGYFFVLRNMVGGDLALLLLPHIVGVSRALEMMLSGELMDAYEAEKVGLVRKVVPQERLMDEAREMALKLMKGAPLA